MLTWKKVSTYRLPLSVNYTWVQEKSSKRQARTKLFSSRQIMRSPCLLCGIQYMQKSDTRSRVMSKGPGDRAVILQWPWVGTQSSICSLCPRFASVSTVFAHSLPSFFLPFSLVSGLRPENLCSSYRVICFKCHCFKWHIWRNRMLHCRLTLVKLF